jgi:hypothetical protein
LLLLLVAALLASALPGQEADSAPEISADRIKAGVAYLASDRLEGRGPGTRGEILATEYIAAEFKKAGLKPIGERDTYFQPVPLVRVVTSPKSTLRATKGETTLDIPCVDGPTNSRKPPGEARRRASSFTPGRRRGTRTPSSGRPRLADTCSM